MKNIFTKEVEDIMTLISNLQPYEQQQLMCLFIALMLQDRGQEEAEKTYNKIINHLKQ
jgi:hypothetical protein